MTQEFKQFGDYQIIRRIGRGGFGTVYLASNTLFPEHRFVIKVLSATDADEDLMTSFYDELRHLVGLVHPNIVQVRGFGREPSPYIVMDFVEGPNGNSYNLKQHVHANGGRLTPIETKRLFRQILSALALVHSKQVAHLDIKPENILLDKEFKAYLTDFGISQTVSSQSLRVDRTPTILGYSPIYASPEQIMHSYGTRHSDIFSLGVILLECLIGQRPEVVHSQTQPRIELTHPSAEGLDPAWDRIVDRTLSIDPAYRFPNAEVFLRALEQVSTHSAQPGEAPMVGEESPHVAVDSHVSVDTVGPHLPLGEVSPPSGQIAQLLEKKKQSGVKRIATADHERRLRARRQINWLVNISGCLVGSLLGWLAGQGVAAAVSHTYRRELAVMLGRVIKRELAPRFAEETGYLLLLSAMVALGGVAGVALAHTGNWLWHKQAAAKKDK